MYCAVGHHCNSYHARAEVAQKSQQPCPVRACAFTASVSSVPEFAHEASSDVLLYCAVGHHCNGYHASAKVVQKSQQPCSMCACQSFVYVISARDVGKEEFWKLGSKCSVLFGDESQSRIQLKVKVELA